MRAVVRAAVLKNYSEVALSVGLNPADMLRSAELLPSALANPENMVPFDAVLKLLEDSAQRSGCRSFGARMAESRELSDFGVVSLLLSHQRTLRDALLTTIEYRHLLNQTLAMSIENHGKTAIIREEVMAEEGVPKSQATELAIGILFRMCASLIGTEWLPQSVNFCHAGPADSSDRATYQRLFRCKLRFDAEFDGFVCASAVLDRPNPKADPAMARYARGFMESMDGQNAETFLFNVRKAIYLLMPVGRATIEQIAHGQGVSVRTLQRQLDEAQITFSQLLNTVRRELVLRYMENRNYSVQRVGMLLGYSVPSSFTRWFLGEFGCAPRVWRSQRKLRPSE